MTIRDIDYQPLLLVPVLAAVALPLIGSGSTWLTLTVAGLAMGMIIFIIASGLTLVFGLMDVLNFGHGVFIALGAFVATSVLGAMSDWTQSADIWRNLMAVVPAMVIAMLVAGAVGLAFERFIVRPVYGQHLKQILITMGGMIIFIVASGLTLVFGLMDVLNFGHGVFIALGAFVATSVMGSMGDWTGSDQLWRNMVAVLPAMLVAMAVAGAVGLAFERFIVRPVYGQHLKQILITMGGMIIGEELIKVIWGPAQIPLPLPEGMRGSLLVGDAAIEKYRLIAVVVGLVVFGVLAWTLSRTKVGLLIRAGVQDREMVESLGYRIRRLFVGVFVVGSALAGLGGVMWGLYQQSVVPQMGAQVNVLIFIVIIIGGLGSTGGALIGALLVGLMANYTGFLAPKVALFSNIALMVAILLWRPQGVYPVTNR